MMADITIEYFYPHVVLTLKETFTAKYNGAFPRTPEVWPKSEIYTTKRDDEHPRPFHMAVPPPRGWNWQRVKDRELRRVKNDDGGRDNAPLCFRWKKKKASNAKWPKRSTIIVFRLCHFLALYKSKSQEDVYVLFQ